MENVQEIRADKYLWAVRVFKTRSQASEACKGNLVKIEGKAIKPSRLLRPGDLLDIEKDIAVRRLRVIALPKSRLGAKLVDEYRENLTPDTPRTKLDFLYYPTAERDRGAGRPTKKERREIETLLDDSEQNRL